MLAGSYDTLLSWLLLKHFQISKNVKLPSEFVMLMPFVRILLDLMFVPVKLDLAEMVKLAQLRIC